MTPQEINEAVAKKFGWVQCCNPMTMENGKIVDCFGWSKGGSHFHEPYPDYCGDIRAAWEIVNYCENELVLYQIDISWSRTGDTWFCTMGTKNQENESVGADTAPKVICLAFLKLP